MTDRELLEFAAKAAGIALTWREPSCGGRELPYVGWGSYTPTVWNPLADDGDALRLANKLRINIERMRTLAGSDFGINCWPVGRGDCGVSEDGDLADYDAATRRAIVRAAAIGKEMP